MSLEKTLLLGFIAGATILLGLPVGRLKRPAPRMRILLNAIAVGVLTFLLWDVLSAAWEPIDSALSDFHAGDGGLGSALGYGLLFIAGISAGLLSLVAYERWMDRYTSDPTRDWSTIQGMTTRSHRHRRRQSRQRVRPTAGLASWSHRATTRAVDRRWYRPSQLCRRACDRPSGGVERDRTRDAARRRLRPSQTRPKASGSLPRSRTISMPTAPGASPAGGSCSRSVRSAAGRRSSEPQSDTRSRRSPSRSCSSRSLPVRSSM